MYQMVEQNVFQSLAWIPLFCKHIFLGEKEVRRLIGTLCFFDKVIAWIHPIVLSLRDFDTKKFIVDFVYITIVVKS